MWRDIFLSNPKNALKSISSFKKSLDALERAIKKEDVGFLMRQLEAAKKKREAIL